MFKHGQAVTLSDPYGVDRQGTLHLPDVLMYGNGGNYWEERTVSGGYAVYTLRDSEGSLFRTEGRLSN